MKCAAQWKYWPQIFAAKCGKPAAPALKMRKSPLEQRLDALERKFKPLLIACLNACSEGRWGLFGQNDSPESGKFRGWPEAEELKQMAEEIQSIRQQFGESNRLCEKFLEYCSMRGANIKGESKLAQQFLDHMPVE